MVNIFLSASVPQKERGAEFYDTADRIAIRDAVRALATVVVPRARLFWGGHPSITPLIRDIVLELENSVELLREHVTLYQSEEYRDKFPKDNFDFEDIVLIDKGKDKKDSQRLLREAMLEKKNFAAAIFIGGMQGVMIEYDMFRHLYRDARVFPVASTGGGARLLYSNLTFDQKETRLLNDYAYESLFEDLLGPILG